MKYLIIRCFLRLSSYLCPMTSATHIYLMNQRLIISHIVLKRVRYFHVGVKLHFTLRRTLFNFVNIHYKIKRDYERSNAK